jgi:hypothetical protein
MKTKLTLSELAEKQITNFNPEDYSSFEVGKLNEGQIICYVHDSIGYIALINPQDENYLFFSDEFDNYNYSEYTQNQIDEIFEGLL